MFFVQSLYYPLSSGRPEWLLNVWHIFHRDNCNSAKHSDNNNLHESYSASVAKLLDVWLSFVKKEGMLLLLKKIGKFDQLMFKRKALISTCVAHFGR